MSITAGLRALRLDLAALVWPTACVSCGEPDRDCCLACLVELEEPTPLVERELGVACFARGAYAGPLRAVLLAYKHGGRYGFRRTLGEQLRPPLEAALARCAGPRPPVIVPLPSRRAQVRRRGFRHVDVLVAQALRGRRVAALRCPALRATRGRRGQVGLGPAERAENAARVAVRACARAALRGREVVLVDDIVTTGASVLAARDALEAAGARVVAVAALCAAARHDTPDAEAVG